MTKINLIKMLALAKFLELNSEDDIQESSYNENQFEYGSQEYLVLTDEEADEATKEHIMDSLWAFNADFIASHTNPKLDREAVKALKEIQGRLCESANSLVLALIDDEDHFIQDAISADGRGYFLSGYDGEENEEEIEGQMFFIYRTN